VTVAQVVGRSAFPDHVTNNPAFFSLLATLADDHRADVLSAICSSNYFEVNGKFANCLRVLAKAYCVKQFISDDKFILQKAFHFHIDKILLLQS